MERRCRAYFPNGLRHKRSADGYIVARQGEDGDEGKCLVAYTAAPVEGDVMLAKFTAPAGNYGPSVTRLAPDIVIFDTHYGKTDPNTEATPWGTETAEEALAIPVVSAVGDGTYTQHTFLIDTRGNVRVVGEKKEKESDGEEETDPPKPAPHCGHPLNDDPAEEHPLGGGGSGGTEQEEDDTHPLDYEGDGGFTPTCGDS